MHTVAHIAELWRYPVKSMGGESVPALELTLDGIAGDRLYAFSSPRAPIGYPLLHSTERTRMLRSRATLTGTLPTVHPPGHPARSITDPDLPATLDAEANLTLLESETPLTDVRPVALHSTQTIAQLTQELGHPFDPRRLRSNIILDLTEPGSAAHGRSPQRGAPALGAFPGFPEDLFTGRTLQLGPTARLHITERIPRCRIVSLAPETALADPTVLRHLSQHHNARAGIYARPLTPGTLCLGDPVTLLA